MATFFAVVGLFLFSIPLSTMTVDIVSDKRNEKIVTIVRDSARCIDMIAKHEKELTVADDNDISNNDNNNKNIDTTTTTTYIIIQHIIIIHVIIG